MDKVIRNVLTGVAIASAATMISVMPTVAHHTGAMFESDVEVELTGVVDAVRYSNPHVYVRVAATEKDGEALGEPQLWSIEFGGTNIAIMQNLPASAFVEGGPIVIRVRPLRNGDPGGMYVHMVMLNNVVNASTTNTFMPAE